MSYEVYIFEVFVLEFSLGNIFPKPQRVRIVIDALVFFVITFKIGCCSSLTPDRCHTIGIPKSVKDLLISIPETLSAC